MRLKHALLLGTLAMALSACAGCEDDPSGSDASGGSGGSGGSSANGGSGGAISTPPISAKHAIRFKTKDRLLKDFSTALGLPVEQMCNELGLYDCTEVHAIALGGVDAYGAGIYEPLKASAITTPIAVDRLALSACSLRALLDFNDLSAAVIFKLDVADDALVDVDAASTTTAIAMLFQRIHLREPKDSETAHLRGLYAQLVEAGSTSPAQDWASLSCYSVLTMMESVFY